MLQPTATKRLTKRTCAQALVLAKSLPAKFLSTVVQTIVAVDISNHSRKPGVKSAKAYTCAPASKDPAWLVSASSAKLVHRRRKSPQRNHLRSERLLAATSNWALLPGRQPAKGGSRCRV